MLIFLTQLEYNYINPKLLLFGNNWRKIFKIIFNVCIVILVNIRLVDFFECSICPKSKIDHKIWV